MPGPMPGEEPSEITFVSTSADYASPLPLAITCSEFSLENEVFKPFFCGQTMGKYVTFVAATAAAARISLRPLPDH